MGVHAGSAHGLASAALVSTHVAGDDKVEVSWCVRRKGDRDLGRAPCAELASGLCKLKPVVDAVNVDLGVCFHNGRARGLEQRKRGKQRGGEMVSSPRNQILKPIRLTSNSTPKEYETAQSLLFIKTISVATFWSTSVVGIVYEQW